MQGFIESWSNLDRWELLNGKLYNLSGGKLSPSSSDAGNPLFRFRQNVSMGLAIDAKVHPVDDMVLALVKPSSSIDFFNQGEITFFNVLYEYSFGAFSQQFIINYRVGWDSPLQSYSFPMLSYDTGYRVLIGVSRSGSLTVKIYDSSSALLLEHTIDGILSGEMTFLVDPGRYNSTTKPWVDECRFAWDMTDLQLVNVLAAGAIEFAPVSAPDVTGSARFVEGVYGSWTSPTFGASGVITVEPVTPLPAGLSVVMEGSSLTIFGAPASGTAGSYPLSFLVNDGMSTRTVSFDVSVVILSSWEASSGMTEQALSFGDYYYEISGGPLRKEFHYPEGSA